MAEVVAIIAALPREVAGLVRGITPDAALLRRKIVLYRLPNAVVVAAGMGAGRAALGVEAALACGGITAVLSVGVAGACDPTLRVGEVVRAGVVVDARTGERFGNSQYKQVLVTTADIASVAGEAAALCVVRRERSGHGGGHGRTDRGGAGAALCGHQDDLRWRGV